MATTASVLLLRKLILRVMGWSGVLLLFFTTNVFAAQAVLSWGVITGASGYRVYQAQTNETAVNLTTTHVTDLSPVVSDTTTTTATVNLLEGKTTYFAIKAYNSTTVSDFSNEVGKTLLAPSTNFSADKTSGPAPLTIQFTDSSTDATAWSWSFGDNTSSTAQNPAKTYTSAGLYTVTLIATGPGGSNTAIKTNYITVNAPSTAPVASFTATPTSGPAPLLVTFTDTSTGTVTSRTWDFGNGQTSTSQNPSLTYSTAGTYTVKLTVNNSSGSSTTTKTISATAAKPVANFTAMPTSGSAPLLVTFTDTSTGTVTNRIWDFGNGQTSTAQNASITYNAAGTYSAKLTVSNSSGSSTTTKTISATSAAPKADFTASPLSGVAPLAVTFSDNSTGTIVGYSWNFGDNTTSTSPSPTKTYVNPGAYNVTLTVTGPTGTTPSTKAQTITVLSATASISGLVAAYNFEEASGSTAVDASGKGNHGAITEAIRIAGGKFGQALSFDGVNDWVTVKDSTSLDLTNGMTLEAWVYPSATMSSWRSVLLKEQSGGLAYGLYANSDVSQPVASINIGNDQNLPGGSLLATYTWTHLAATYDGVTERLYINGKQVASKAQTGGITVSTGALRIGGNSVWDEFFKGRIDEIRIYNRALSASEIQTDMAKPIADASPPSLLLGDQAIGSKTDTISKGTAKAFQKQAAKTGQITNLSVYVLAGSTPVVAGLYANNNGRPGALLAQGTLNSPKAGDWNKIALPAIPVTAGRTYWIAILSPGGSLQVSDKVGSGAQPSETSPVTKSITLPTSWWTSGTPSYDSPLTGYGAGY